MPCLSFDEFQADDVCMGGRPVADMVPAWSHADPRW